MTCRSRFAVKALAVSTTVAALVASLAAVGELGQVAVAQVAGKPTIARVAIGSSGVGLIEGSAAPGMLIVVQSNGRTLGQAVADAGGLWRVAVPGGLPAGAHALSATARNVPYHAVMRSDEIRITVRAGAPVDVVPTLSGQADDARLRRRASELAEAASRRFDELMPTIKLQDRGSDSVRVAQAGPGQNADKARRSPVVASDADPLSSVWQWLDRSSQAYQRTIVRPLASGGPAAAGTRTGPAAPGSPGAPATRPPPVPPAAVVAARQQAGARDSVDFLTRAQINVQGWLERASRQYDSVIVRRLETGGTVQTLASAPGPQSGARPAAGGSVVAQGSTPRQSETPATTQRQAPAGNNALTQVQDDVQGWLDRANKQYRNLVVDRLRQGAPQEVASGAPAAERPPLGRTAAPVTADSRATALKSAPAGPPPAAGPAAAGPGQRAAPAGSKDVVAQVQDNVQDWLERANKSYRSVIVGKLAQSGKGDSGAGRGDRGAGTAQAPPSPAPRAVAQAPTTRADSLKEIEAATRKAEQQRRESEGRRLVELTAKKKAEDAKSSEDRAAAEARRVAEAARAKIEADKRAAEQARLQAERKLAAEREAADAKRRADAAAAAEARRREAQARAEAQRKAAEEAQRLARLKEEAARQAARARAEAQRKTAEEARRLAALKVEEERRAARARAEAKQKADDEARRLAALKSEEERRLAEARAAAQRKAAEEARRLAAMKAEEERMAARARADAQRKAAEESRRLAQLKVTEDRRAQREKAEAERKAAAETRRLAALKAEQDRRGARAKAEADRAEAQAADARRKAAAAAARVAAGTVGSQRQPPAGRAATPRSRETETARVDTQRVSAGAGKAIPRKASRRTASRTRVASRRKVTRQVGRQPRASVAAGPVRAHRPAVRGKRGNKRKLARAARAKTHKAAGRAARARASSAARHRSALGARRAARGWIIRKGKRVRAGKSMSRKRRACLHRSQLDAGRRPAVLITAAEPLTALPRWSSAAAGMGGPLSAGAVSRPGHVAADRDGACALASPLQST